MPYAASKESQAKYKQMQPLATESTLKVRFEGIVFPLITSPFCE